jgi:hypothetical protein
MGGVYRDDPSTYDKARADAAESAKAYYAMQNEMCQRRLEQNDFEDGPGGGGWTKDACIRTLKSNEDWIRRVSESDVRYPAHLSVAVFVDGIPPAEVLDEMKRRAEYFARNYGSISRRFLGIGKESIEVTGFRFVEPESRLVEHTI